MTLFEYLILAHVLGDWILQNEWQAMHKRERWRALVSHVVVYHALILGVLLWREGPGRPMIYAVVAGLFLTHAVLDRYTVVPLMRLLRINGQRESDRLLELAVDQSVHVLLLGLAVQLVVSTRPPGG